MLPSLKYALGCPPLRVHDVVDTIGEDGEMLILRFRDLVREHVRGVIEHPS